jgi:hypothetical protein
MITARFFFVFFESKKNVFLPHITVNKMKRILLTLLACLATTISFAGNILTESFEYGNHENEVPVGWNCDDQSWLCGYLESDHNRKPHTGNWYVYSDGGEAWMFMPIYLIEEMRYRFSCWAISDGAVTLEFWAGTAPDADNMHTLLLEALVNSNKYERFSNYVEAIPLGCEYIGIHAVGQQDDYLSIDDVEIDMVQQYDFIAEPVTGDTAMYPGTQAIFHYLVHNTGYDPVDITAHPSDEFFTDFSCYVNGVCGMTFSTQPDETVEVTTYATLRPEVEPGTVAWLDILMTIPCNCNTAMVTFWVTPLDITQTDENNALKISVFPNPATDFVTIAAEGLQEIKVIDFQGRAVMIVPIKEKQSIVNISQLKSGMYFIMAESQSSIVRRLLIKQ